MPLYIHSESVFELLQERKQEHAERFHDRMRIDALAHSLFERRGRISFTLKTHLDFDQDTVGDFLGRIPD